MLLGIYLLYYVHFSHLTYAGSWSLEVISVVFYFTVDFFYSINAWTRIFLANGGIFILNQPLSIHLFSILKREIDIFMNSPSLLQIPPIANVSHLYNVLGWLSQSRATEFI